MQKILKAMAIAVACSVSVAAQWPKHEEAGVPRDAKGQPAARRAAASNGRRQARPLRRLAENRSGSRYRPSLPGSSTAAIRRQDAVAAPRRPAALPPAATDPNSPPVAAFWDIGTNLKDGLPLTPWAAEIKKQRMATNSVNNPDANCLPLGIHPLHTHPDPRQIIQTPKLVVIA